MIVLVSRNLIPELGFAVTLEANMSGFNELQSKWLGAMMERIVRSTGGNCETVNKLRVCRSGKISLYARGGTQWGDLFITGKAPESLESGLITHETYHRDAQWRRYGWWFAVMYLGAEVTDVWFGRKPYNRYELAAEEASDFGGGYPRPSQSDD